jgi:hypothetical protein
MLMIPTCTILIAHRFAIRLIIFSITSSMLPFLHLNASGSSRKHIVQFIKSFAKNSEFSHFCNLQHTPTRYLYQQLIESHHEVFPENPSNTHELDKIYTFIRDLTNAYEDPGIIILHGISLLKYGHYIASNRNIPFFDLHLAQEEVDIPAEIFNNASATSHHKRNATAQRKLESALSHYRGEIERARRDITFQLNELRAIHYKSLEEFKEEMMQFDYKDGIIIGIERFPATAYEKTLAKEAMIFTVLEACIRKFRPNFVLFLTTDDCFATQSNTQSDKFFSDKEIFKKLKKAHNARPLYERFNNASQFLKNIFRLKKKFSQLKRKPFVLIAASI